MRSSFIDLVGFDMSYEKSKEPLKRSMARKNYPEAKKLVVGGKTFICVDREK